MDSRIAVVVACMEQTLEQGASLAELAAAVNLSVSRLSHLFREEIGVAPGRYLQVIRMQRARILLERTFLNVKEVMACVGVADPSHFARDFRKYHGLAPSQVRRAGGQAGDAPSLMTHLNVGGAAMAGGGGAAVSRAGDGGRPPARERLSANDDGGPGEPGDPREP
jgi:AraC-like DNA-binding protein